MELTVITLIRPFVLALFEASLVEVDEGGVSQRQKTLIFYYVHVFNCYFLALPTTRAMECFARFLPFSQEKLLSVSVVFTSFHLVDSSALEVRPGHDPITSSRRIRELTFLSLDVIAESTLARQHQLPRLGLEFSSQFSFLEQLQGKGNFSMTQDCFARSGTFLSLPRFSKEISDMSTEEESRELHWLGSLKSNSFLLIGHSEMSSSTTEESKGYQTGRRHERE